MEAVESLQEQKRECSLDSYMFLEGRMQNLRLAILDLAGKLAKAQQMEISRETIQTAIDCIKNDRRQLARLLSPNESEERK